MVGKYKKMADTSKVNVKTAFQTPDQSRSRDQDVILSSCPPPKCHLLPYVTGGLSSLLRTVKYGHTSQDGETDVAEKGGGVCSLVKNGSLIGKRYRVLGAIGRGGSAVVIKARDTFRPGKFYVAIKILNKGFFALGYQESNCVRRLNQADPQGISGVIKLLNTFHFDGHYCTVYELLQPNPLHHYFGNITPEEKLPLIRRTAIKLLQLLGFLQKQNVIHADLKPENILCVEGDTNLGIKVIDFGNAIHCVYDELALYYEDYELQTIIYRAPEVMCGLPFGTEVDLWSVGCILAELFIGRPLFFAQSKGLILGKIYQLLGPLPIHVYQRGKFFQDFEHLGGPAQPFIETFNKLRSVLLNTTCADFVSFILGFLSYDISKRMTVQEAIQHPFLAPELAIGLFMPSDQAFNPCYSKGISLQPSQYKHSPHVQKESQMKSSLQLLRNGTTGPEWSLDRVARVVAQVTPIVRGIGKAGTKNESKVDVAYLESGSSPDLRPRRNCSLVGRRGNVKSSLDHVDLGQSLSLREQRNSSPVGLKVEEYEETAEQGVQSIVTNMLDDSKSSITYDENTDEAPGVKANSHRMEQMYRDGNQQHKESNRQSKGGNLTVPVTGKTPASAVEQLQNSATREVRVRTKRKRQVPDASKVGSPLRTAKLEMIPRCFEVEGEKRRKPKKFNESNEVVTPEEYADGSENDVDDSHVGDILRRSCEKQVRSREKITISKKVVNCTERDGWSERTKVGLDQQGDCSFTEDHHSEVYGGSKFGLDSGGKKSKRNPKTKESIRRKVKLGREVKETSERTKRRRSLKGSKEVEAADKGRKLVAVSACSSSKQRMAFEVYSQMEEAEFQEFAADRETGVPSWARKLDFGDNCSINRAAKRSPGYANQGGKRERRTKHGVAEILPKQKPAHGGGASSVGSLRSVNEGTKETSSLKCTVATVSENCNCLTNKKRITNGKQLVGTNTVQKERPKSIRGTQVDHKGEGLARSKTKASVSGRVRRAQVFEQSQRKASLDESDKPQKRNGRKRGGQTHTKKRAQTERYVQKHLDKSRKCQRMKRKGKVTGGEWSGGDEERHNDRTETDKRRGECEESGVPVDIIITPEKSFREDDELIQSDFVMDSRYIESGSGLAERETPRSPKLQDETKTDPEPPEEEEEDEVLLL